MATNSPNVQANVPYNPLPHSERNAEHYEMSENLPVPHSPGPQSHDFDRSQSNTPRLPNIDDIPPGAAAPIPRFYGSALSDERPRYSYADSFDTSGAPSVGYDQSSLHALDPSHDISGYPNRYSSPLMSESTPYRDNPNEYPSGTDSPRVLQEKQGIYTSPKKKSRRGLIIGAIVAAIVVIAIVAVVAVYFTVIKKNNDNSDTSGGSSDGSDSDHDGKPQNNIAKWGGDGTEVTTEDGTKFTYTNSFEGFWVQDPSNPFNNSAKAQSWTPALSEKFNYGVDKVRGVNLGGWLTVEPFIVPALFEKYEGAIDEWTLSEAMKAAGGFDDLENHYKTFITEKDFAEIAAAGLNYVRIPIPFWAIETRGDEPFLEGVAWKYFLKAVQWARKYGIRINLDLHAVPGSQNGWNHSGRYGQPNFLIGVSGMFNAQRTLGYLQTLAQFISQPQYKDVITMFGIINEPRASPFIGQENLARWYMEAYQIIRNVTGYGEGNGPIISIHDGFLSLSNWYGIFPNADRVAIDTHPYIAFGGQSTASPGDQASTPCEAWGNRMNDSLAEFGITTAGEFSLAVNDCGKWVNGVNNGTRYEGEYADGGNAPPRVGSCDRWTNWPKYSAADKAGLKQFALSSMDSLQNYFFWTWKIGNSSVTGKVEAPFWSYQLGLEQGWMPKDPREATGACAKIGKSATPFQAPLQPYMTGGQGAGPIPTGAVQQYAWPPEVLSSAGPVSGLPYYTPTASAPTLPAPTFGKAVATGSPDVGNGWFNPDQAPIGYVEVQGCEYPNEYAGLDAPAPASTCGPGLQRRAPTPTPAPTPIL